MTAGLRGRCDALLELLADDEADTAGSRLQSAWPSAETNGVLHPLLDHPARLKAV